MSNGCQMLVGALEASNNSLDPIGALVKYQPHIQNFYHNHPVTARVLFGTTNTILGAIKVLALPVTAPISAVALAVFGGVKACQGEGRRAGQLLLGSAITLLSGLAVAGFFYLAATHMTFVQTGATLAGATAISIIIHVWRVVQEPPAPLPLNEVQEARPVLS